MRAVAIETSGRVGSVAVVSDGVVVAEAAFPHELKHAAGLVPLMDRLVREREWSPASLDELYVSAGPGSFTGLRIGITVAKTLALATGVKLVAVPTLRVLAANAPADARHVLVVLDAKRDQIFTALYDRVGDGLPYHEHHLPADRDGLVATPPEAWRGRAGVVAEIGYRMGRGGRFVDADALLPVYVRKPEAEEKYEAAHGAA